ncbi:MAG: hypothetical protein NC907_02980, partial [Candidatus Omnitrophica bacterium]|nr:hypothetical protein [Candidatus Omnitrophota bacterium]
MSNKSVVSYSKYILLSAIFSFCTAFSWGNSNDPCINAKSLIKDYETEKNSSEKASIEQKIIKECPDGA